MNEIKSFATTRLFIDDMLDYFSVCVWMRTIMNLLILKLSTCSLKFLVRGFIIIIPSSCFAFIKFGILFWIDTFFDNVCELDLVFNFYKVCRFYLKSFCDDDDQSDDEIIYYYRFTRS